MDELFGSLPPNLDQLSEDDEGAEQQKVAAAPSKPPVVPAQRLAAGLVVWVWDPDDTQWCKGVVSKVKTGRSAKEKAKGNGDVLWENVEFGGGWCTLYPHWALETVCPKEG